MYFIRLDHETVNQAIELYEREGLFYKTLKEALLDAFEVFPSNVRFYVHDKDTLAMVYLNNLESLRWVM